jgi:uncharacterized membrane protein YeaQ/YmgE (transglycosylase-associated protein family)
VRAIYASTDLTTAQRLLRRYHVHFFVGSLERRDYPASALRSSTAWVGRAPAFRAGRNGHGAVRCPDKRGLPGNQRPMIGFIVAGLIIGALARLLMPGRQKIGLLWTLLLGLAGSVIGGSIANLLGTATSGSST